MESSQEEAGPLGLPSPPPSSPPLAPKRTMPKKPPPITPKRFTKFFSPRNLSLGLGKSGRILCDITSNGNNRLAPDGYSDLRPTKKRRIAPPVFAEPPSPTYEPISPLPFASSPPPSSPCCSTSTRNKSPYLLHPIEKPRGAWPSASPLSNTASFHTSPDGLHDFARDRLPFCVQACNTNTLVAIGNEEGEVRIIESAKEGKPSFSDSYISFKPHENAIMNLAFSSDDHYLATASGDQTGRIVDMYTQQTLFVLDRHTCSLKQICFMPGNDQLVATCSRDGIVGLWDLRCHTSSGPSYQTSTTTSSSSQSVTRVKMYNSIVDAHAPLPTASSNSAAYNRHSATRSSHTPPIAATTSLTFLPPSLGSHLFLTACADSAQLRLWDVRGRYSSRRGPPIPMSITAPIPSHSAHRNFGINDTSLSTDGARLFAVCKDSTVYAYSTNHILFGQAPELGLTGQLPRWSRSSTGNTGAGPLYGLRNPSFRTGSFYVRSAVRKATDQHAELLAVGSSNSCPVLFPTDESLFHSQPLAPRHAGLQRELSISCSRQPARMTAVPSCDAPPIYTLGTPLVRGHSAEVTGVSFTSDGELVSIGDDHRARIWREDAAVARDLRVGGEGEGKRWGCGWAELPLDDDWDDEDG